jgi:hypothetical protein
MREKIRRNDPCPCGSGKKYKKCCMRLESVGVEPKSWADGEGLHFMAAGAPPSIEEQERMTAEYRRQVMKSPLWKKMVEEYGEEKAAEMLSEFKVKVR